MPEHKPPAWRLRRARRSAGSLVALAGAVRFPYPVGCLIVVTRSAWRKICGVGARHGQRAGLVAGRVRTCGRKPTQPQMAILAVNEGWDDGDQCGHRRAGEHHHKRLAQKCKGCPETTWKGCHETEQLKPRPDKTGTCSEVVQCGESEIRGRIESGLQPSASLLSVPRATPPQRAKALAGDPGSPPQRAKTLAGDPGSPPQRAKALAGDPVRPGLG